MARVLTVPAELVEVADWRLRVLLDAGFNPEDASAISLRLEGPDRIDLHAAVALVQQGCQPADAARILL